jgi:hypothetical protein
LNPCHFCQTPIEVGSVCVACSLRYEIAGNVRCERMRLGRELAELLGCTVEEAIAQADEAFPAYHWSPKAKAKSKPSPLAHQDDPDSVPF